MQVIERVEELFLRAALAGQELDVVHQQQLNRAVAAAELVAPALRDGCDKVVDELLTGDVQGVAAGLPRPQSDRLQEVRLA